MNGDTTIQILFIVWGMWDKMTKMQDFENPGCISLKGIMYKNYTDFSQI